MIQVTVMYPADDKTKFDLDYYMKTHIPLLKERWTEFGLSNVQVLRGAGKPDGSPLDYRVIALLTFGSLDDFKNAGKAHGREIFADIPKFTDGQAVVQINDVVG
ncbi:EthD family reductase [Chelatococcus reniformis]|uniref:EthD domain-containing protein n=1 Tax=Chelatococcus reniformis TaxID=1494448 RepID=A0A916U0H8_9HYPH|nr:EthD family reductase [Chelatococcus reniformis]GGC54830.1 hypothetical protein GCM10010994_12200 [Chelatococcus reniformis]